METSIKDTLIEEKVMLVSPRKKLRRILLLALSAIFLSLLAGYFFYWKKTAQFYVSTNDAYVAGNQVQVMPRISGHVTAILTDETDYVTKGQPLIILDQSDALITLQVAEAQLALTARQVVQLYDNVKRLQANVAVQQENLIKAQEDLQRREKLILNESISQEDLQHAKITVDSAAAALDLAKQQLAAAIGMVNNSDLYHHPQIEQAKINLRNAYLAWRRTTIYAPESGYIAKRNVQVGEEINPTMPLMIIIPLNQLWVDANFKESQLSHIRIGQPVTLTSDLYGDHLVYKGTVVGLSPGTGSSFDLLPPQNATGNWIKIVQRLPVRIALDPQQLAKHPLRIGLSMNVNIDTHDRSGAILKQLPRNNVIYQTQNYSDDLKNADKLINNILRANAPNLIYENKMPLQ